MEPEAVIHVEAYNEAHRSAVLSLSLKAWAPVFAALEPAVAPYAFEAFYPNGWSIRQCADIEHFLDSEPQNVSVVIEDDDVVGWVAIRKHTEDSMGEIYILAVDPAAQRKGVARALLEAAFEQLRVAGMKIVMVETGDDPGHEPSRITYERVGFQRWPVAQYFREL